MRLPANLTEAAFLSRLNRFAAMVRLGDGEVMAHVANSGRLRELLVLGTPVYLTPAASNPKRKTQYDLSLVDLGHCLVSADARVPNSLVSEWLQEHLLPEFQTYRQVLREKSYLDSRLDIALVNGSSLHYIEVKSVTLVRDGAALFPDAPTTRGQRHVSDLARAVEEGHRASIIFVVQRPDAAAFAPNDAADPAFGEALRLAHSEGVGVYAYSCSVSLKEIALKQRLPVYLGVSGSGVLPAISSAGASAP